MAFPTIKPDGGGVAEAVIAPNLPQYARSTSVTLEVGFYDDAARTVPSVPANGSGPTFTITDLNGTQVLTGTGIPGSLPGRWQTTWTVPATAPLTTQNGKWLITWNMVTGTARQLTQVNPFDVIELRTPDTLEDLRSHAYLVYAGNPERLVLRLPKQPVEMTVAAYQALGLTTPVPSSTASFTGSLAGSTITVVEEQNMFSFVFDTPPMTGLGEYQIVWTYRYTLTSPTETVVQKLFVPPPVFFSLAPSMKVLIDKLQKKSGTIHAYVDSDIYEYLLRGLGYLNTVTPVSNWDLCTFPYTSFTTRFLIEAACLCAIQAQHLLSAELQFSFSGQSITLDIDQTSALSEVIQRLMDDLTGDGKGSWPAAKVGLMRATGNIAHVSNRLMGRYQYNQYTAKVSTSTIGSGSPYLSGTGAGIGLNWTLSDAVLWLGL